MAKKTKPKPTAKKSSSEWLVGNTNAAKDPSQRVKKMNISLTPEDQAIVKALAARIKEDRIMPVIRYALRLALAT